MTILVHTLIESVAHLVGGQLPKGHVSDIPIVPVNLNALPNGENQREEVEETRERLAVTTIIPLPRGMLEAIRGEVVKG